MTPSRGVATAELIAIGVPILIIGALAILFLKSIKKSLTVSSVQATATQVSMLVTNTTSSIVQFYPVIAFPGARFQGNLSSIGANGSGTFTITYASQLPMSSYIVACTDQNNNGISNIVTGNLP